MEAKDVIAFRNQFDKAIYTRYHRITGEAKTFKPQIHICCDNSLNAIDDREGSVIWDDANERFYWFKANTPGSYVNTGTSMSFGHKVHTAMEVICVDFGEIQNMRIVMDRDMFDKYVAELGSLISAEQKQHLINTIFEETDMNNVIPRKKQVSYVTGVDKRADISSKHYDDLDEYNKTIHKN